MAGSAGLWIDHRKAVVVILSGAGEEIVRMESGVDPHVRYSGGGEAEGEFKRERRFENDLHAYYDRVVERVRDVDAILLFGPGEAKGELKTRLERDKRADRVVGVETVDKMTEPQIVAKVRQRFPG
jgi:hypothetical protein